MLTGIIRLAFVLLGCFVALSAQATTLPAAVPENSAALASQSAVGQPTTAPGADKIAVSQPDRAVAPLVNAPPQRTGRRILGLPLHWVIVGTAVVASIIAIAAIVHNRSPSSYKIPTQ